MSTADRSLPDPLRARLLRTSKDQSARLARLAGCASVPSVGDVYAIPLPITGPETWCVTGCGEPGLATLVPVDERPFFEADDLWVAVGDGDLCLRRASPCNVPLSVLQSVTRADHIPELPEALAEAGSVSRAEDTMHAPDEAEWRRSVARTSRLLGRWLEDRCLVLRLEDLHESLSTSAMEARPMPLLGSWSRLAAAPNDAAERFEHAALARKLGVRREEIDCEGGRLTLLVSLQSVGMTFEAEGLARPPRVLVLPDSAASKEAVWDFDPATAQFRCAWRHDVMHAAARVEVGTRSPFRIEIANTGLWS